MLARSAVGLGLVLLVTNSSAFAYTCPTEPNTLYIKELGKVTTILTGQVSALEAAVSLARMTTVQMLVSGKKVGTAQLSANGSREGLMTKASQLGMAEATNEDTRRSALLKIQDQFSPDTGVGVNACEAVADNQKALGALNAVPEKARALSTEPDTAPGNSGNQAGSYQARLGAKDATDAGLLLRGGGDKQGDIIANLSGIAMPKPTGALIGTPEGEVMMRRAQVVEALRSPGLVSLSAVRAMNTAGLGEGGFTGTPLQALDDVIDRYGGGGKYQTWSVGLMDQSERGLLTELLRLRAMSAAMRETQAQQTARITAVVGTMLASQIQDAQ